MIAIINRGELKGEDPLTGLTEYTVGINYRVLVKFTHKRSDGLAVCLDKAAEAVRNADLDSP